MSTRPSKKNVVSTVETLNPVSGEVKTVTIEQTAPTPQETNLTRLQAHQEANVQKLEVVHWQNGTLRLVRKHKENRPYSFIQDALFQWMDEFSGKLIDALVGLETIDGLTRGKTYASRDDNGVMTVRIAYTADWPIKDNKTGDIKKNDAGEIVMGKRYYILTFNSNLEASFDGVDSPLTSKDVDKTVKFLNTIDPSFALLQLQSNGNWKKVDKGNFHSIFGGDQRTRHDEPNLYNDTRS